MELIIRHLPLFIQNESNLDVFIDPLLYLFVPFSKTNKLLPPLTMAEQM